MRALTRTFPFWIAVLMAASARAQWKVEFAPEYFYWEERENGVKLLDEAGVRFGLEGSYKQVEDHGWIAAGRSKVYYGLVDYDGFQINLRTGATRPHKATTAYYGALLEGRYGYRFGLGAKQFLDVMGGLGIETWLRDLRGAGGYYEYWFPIYLKAGIEVAPSKETGWIGALGLKAPVYTTQVADLGRIGGTTITAHPRVNPSAYAEAGYQFTKSFSFVAFADSYWFRKSGSQVATFTTSSGTFQAVGHQPESRSYQIGAKLGWTF